MKFIEKLLSKNSSEKMIAAEIGAIGENEAVRILKKHGYKILERNFRTRFGEIDVIAKKDGYTCFVEVRLRKNNLCGSPSETVDIFKQRKLICAAKIYAVKNKIYDTPMRFDFVGINADSIDGQLCNIKYEVIENAFFVQGF